MIKSLMKMMRLIINDEMRKTNKIERETIRQVIKSLNKKYLTSKNTEEKKYLPSQVT